MNKSITITGDLGSGKSSISILLNKALGYEIKSIGSIQRQLAQELNMSINEFNKYMETHPQIDQDLDDRVVELGKQDIPRIYDSRLAWHFIPNSFKIYLYVSLDISAERVLKDTNRINESHQNAQSAKHNLTERRNSELLRFKKQYNVDLIDYNNYDLVIDTGHSTPEHLANTILECYNAYLTGKKTPKFWVSPLTLFPTQSIKEASPALLQEVEESVRNCGFEEGHPVRIVKSNDNFYIYEGHKRVSASLKQNISLIPAELIGTDNDLLPSGQTVAEYINLNYKQNDVHEWETMHSISILR